MTGVYNIFIYINASFVRRILPIKELQKQLAYYVTIIIVDNHYKYVIGLDSEWDRTLKTILLDNIQKPEQKWNSTG